MSPFVHAVVQQDMPTVPEPSDPMRPSTSQPKTCPTIRSGPDVVPAAAPSAMQVDGPRCVPPTVSPVSRGPGIDNSGVALTDGGSARPVAAAATATTREKQIMD